MLPLYPKTYITYVPAHFGKNTDYRYTTILPDTYYINHNQSDPCEITDLIAQSYINNRRHDFCAAIDLIIQSLDTALIDFKQFIVRASHVTEQSFCYFRYGRIIKTFGLFDDMVFEFRNISIARRAAIEFQKFKNTINKILESPGGVIYKVSSSQNPKLFQDAQKIKSVYDPNFPHTDPTLKLDTCRGMSNFSYILGFDKFNIRGWFFTGFKSDNFPEEIKDFIAGILIPSNSGVVNTRTFICIINPVRYTKWNNTMKTEDDVDKFGMLVRRFLYGLKHNDLLSWYAARDMHNVVESLGVGRSHQAYQFNLNGPL